MSLHVVPHRTNSLAMRNSLGAADLLEIERHWAARHLSMRSYNVPRLITHGI